MAEIGSLAVRVSANTRPYAQGMRGTRGPAQKLRRDINAVTKTAARMSAGMAAAGAAITAALVNRGLEAVDAQAKLARQIGTTHANLAGLVRVGKDAGVEQQQLERNIQAFNKRLGEAQEGSGEAAAALDKLGLSADELAQMPLDKRLDTIGAAIRGLDTKTEQAAATADLFSRSGLSMMNIFEQGPGQIAEASREMRGFGVAVSAVDAAQVEAANDAMSRISDVIQGVSNRLAVELAPIIEAVAKLFTDAAKDSKGFNSEIKTGVAEAVEIVGFLADSVEGVRRTFLVAGKAVAAAALLIQKHMLGATEMILSGPVDAINTLIRTANQVPGVDFGEVKQPKLVEAMKAQVDVATEAVEQAKADIHTVLMEPMPSDAIDQWFQDVKSASKNAADQVINDRERETTSVEDLLERLRQKQNKREQEDMARDQERRKRKREQIAADLQRRLGMVQDHLRTEQEQVVAAHERRMEWLREARNKELVTEAEFNKMKEELQKQHQDRMEDFEKKGVAARVSAVAGGLKAITSTMATESKAAFKIQKAAATADAIVSTYQGINKALGAYPYPYNLAPAAAVAARGFANVQSIKAQSFASGGGSSGGGGGGGGGGASGSGAAGGQPQQPPPIQAEIRGLDPGQMFSGEQVGGLLDSLMEEAGDRGLRLTVAR